MSEETVALGEVAMSTQYVDPDAPGSHATNAEFLSKATVAVIAAESAPAALVEGLLRFYGTRVTWLESAREYLAGKCGPTDTCLLLDLQLPDKSGLELQHRLGRPAPPTIFMGRAEDISAAIRAMKAGAHEFLIKPLDPADVFTAIHDALRVSWLRRRQCARLARLKQRLASLSARERQILPLLLEGLRNKQAAWRLGISEVTVQIHRSHVMRKMQARSFAELVKMGQALGITPRFLQDDDYNQSVDSHALRP